MGKTYRCKLIVYLLFNFEIKLGNHTLGLKRTMQVVSGWKV